MEPNSESTRPFLDGRRSEANSLEEGFGFRIGRLHRILRDAWGDKIANLGLSPPQAAMLRAVCERTDSGVRELARWTRTDATNAKRLADYLEHLELIYSSADPSHRQRRLLCPTEHGVKLANEVSERSAEWNRELTEMIGADEFRQLESLLELVEQVLEFKYFSEL
ncbi:MAG: MarR family transcriptional regulator [Actinomycetota bacterium]|nr:MAG: MarR family transcriptional regulator [Actinomycetota bacterium]